MKWMKYRNSIIYFLLFAVGISSYYFVQQSGREEENKNKIISRLQKADQATISAIENAGILLKEILIKPSKDARLISAFDEISKEYPQLTILIVKNEEPKFWQNLQLSKPQIQSLPFLKNAKLEKLENGFYYYQKLQLNGYLVFIARKIKNDYAYSNEYLNQNFLGAYQNLGLSSISLNKPTSNEYFEITNPVAQKYFVRMTENSFVKSFRYSLFLMLAYILSIIFFSSFLRSLYLIFNNKLHLRSGLMLILFSLDVILIRVVLFYFDFPASLQESLIFDPRFFASSGILPSLGDFFINSVLLLYLAFTFHRFYQFRSLSPKKSDLRKTFAVFSLYLHIFIFLGILSQSIENLVFNSSINLNLNNLYNLNSFTALGYVIFSVQIVAYLLVSGKLIEISKKYGFKKGKSFSILLAAIAAYFIFKYLRNNDPFYWVTILTAALYLAGSILLNATQFTGFYKNLLKAVALAIFFTIIFDLQIHQKEKHQRSLLAGQILLSNSDPEAEYLFTKIKQDIKADAKIQKECRKYGQGEVIDESALNEYIQTSYFQGFWKKFNIQFTLCKANDRLTIESIDNEVNCFAFFGHLKSEYGDPSSFSDQLYQIEYDNGENGYLGIIRLISPDSSQIAVRYYLEFMPMKEIKEMGYPELLLDSEAGRLKIPQQYSWGIYQDDELIYRNGNYGFENKIESWLKPMHEYHGDVGDYLFYFTQIDNKSIKILKRKASIPELLTPFSYIFVLIILLQYILVSRFKFPKTSVKISLLQKLQFVILGIFIIAYFLIAESVLSLLVKLDEEKNMESLNEKTHSILIEMQHKLSDQKNIHQIDEAWLNQLLTKFSNVFFTDINLFDLHGRLIASSRKEIFEQGLSSNLMNFKAFKELKFNKKSYYIQKESIGKQEYYSSYIPFVNEKHNAIAYLNLPYFARQTDLQREVSSVVATFINLYVLITIFIILGIVLLSRLITRPVQLLVEKIKSIKLGHQNEKIDWKSSDEFSYLIEEYNRMVDELELSAEKLAVSEREGAWRDVARQVAHEIKNPLTPMKLSVQQLMRSWNDKDPEFEARLNRFQATLITEIETLSDIASEFSRFAKMPKPEFDTTDLLKLAHTAKSLFENTHIQISLDFDPKQDYIIQADKRLLNQVFNNILKNASQAIPAKIDGKIFIKLKKYSDKILISITDNGLGINEDVKERIFEPKFTTKSSGMGLGLAMVKTIIEQHQGKIRLESEAGRGTTFYFELPLHISGQTN